MREMFVQRFISSMTPVPAVPRPISLLVAIEVVKVLLVDKSPQPERGAVVEIDRAGCTEVSARAREAIEALSRAIVPVVVIGQPVRPVPVATLVTVPVPSPMALIVISAQSEVGEPERVIFVPAFRLRTEALPAFFTPSTLYSCPLLP